MSWFVWVNSKKHIDKDREFETWWNIYVTKFFVCCLPLQALANIAHLKAGGINSPYVIFNHFTSKPDNWLQTQWSVSFKTSASSTASRMFAIFKHVKWRHLQQICARNSFLFACPVRQLLWQHVNAPAEKAVNKHFSDASCQMLSDVVSDARCVILLVRLNHLVGHNVKCLMPAASDAKCLTLVVWLKHWMRLGPMSAGAASCQWCQMFDESWFPVMMPDVWCKLQIAWISI